MSVQMMLFDTGEHISSPASAAGNTPFSLRAGQSSGPSGPAPVPANRFRVPADAAVRRTNGTSGRNSTVSSASADLARSLGSRLQARMDVNGSMEYRLTWKSWGMPSRRRICALRARAHRTFDSGFFGLPLWEVAGWPTTNSTDNKGPSNRSPGKERPVGDYDLPTAVAFLTGWPTARSTDGDKGIRTSAGAIAEFERKGTGADLPTIASIAGWATPNVPSGGQTFKEGYMSPTGQTSDGQKRSVHLQEQVQMLAPGPIMSSSPAGTARRGGLNPAFSCWLMGFPSCWLTAAPVRPFRVRRSSRGSATR